jgi:hypothetical protein
LKRRYDDDDGGCEKKRHTLSLSFSSAAATKGRKERQRVSTRKVKID